MLGEHIGGGQGTRTARRVISTEPQFKVEVSFEENTKLLGIEGLNIGTYITLGKPDGSLQGEGEGVVATSDGHFLTWRGIGVGKYGTDGSVRYRGCLTYNTISAKLARLNGIAGVFEFEVDPNGKTQSKVWEWK